ncbi:MAG TPA: UDP-2,3-diacylglucosamine diphosphatase [Tenuifilaceae bacterium]|nr:UDP-2,3-diacylglucosamine diphosphatase [Tenuifilaceae bacterium]
MKDRQLDIAVISDLHLATYACKPKKILKYLKSIKPQMLVLNGDIIDSWRFSRNYFPKNHMRVVRQIIKMMEKGVKVYYITGNHDEFLRKFSPVEAGNLKIVDRLVLDQDGGKTLILHGDIFDHSIYMAKWLAKIGAAGKGMLSLIDAFINGLLGIFGRKDFILYKTINQKLNRERSTLIGYEKSMLKSCAEQGYQTVICGHTHFPIDRELLVSSKRIHYLNCGDWVEHCTAAEYYNGGWHLYVQADSEDELLYDEPEIPAGRQLYQKVKLELAFSNLG